VLEFGAEILGTLPTFRAVRSVKFQRIIQPGHSLRLHIAAEMAGSTLRFEYESEAGRYSAGIIETRGAGD
jgi:3-hydroxymyristoyl/3-hydroxydecanoyl-(acyl carrier protein) dehydratase